MSDNSTPEGAISAEPTKAFFVEMLTRDIKLEQAVLDLVDNCIDGAKRLHPGPDARFEGREIKIDFDSTQFCIVDNCGGFDIATARDYAFRFGRAAGSTAIPHSIGQFGVGMKRALFKFGKRFIVRSATPQEQWAIDIDVNAWESQEGWVFPWADFGDESEVSKGSPGTEVIVRALRQEISTRFGTNMFLNSIRELIKSKHRQFISSGLRVSVNGQHVDAVDLYLCMTGDLKPGVDELIFAEEGISPVKARIKVGVGNSNPREAGWYVICNGRVVLESDRREDTGWGLIENETGRLMMPGFHNQFARFRGVVSFDSDDSGRVPWNTTKDDVDKDSAVWQKTFQRMMEMMRPVITFLNDLDSDIDEFTRKESPLLEYVDKAERVNIDSITKKEEFSAPKRYSITKRVPTIKVQYSKSAEDVKFMQRELSVSTARAVGEKTFNLIFNKLRDK